MDLGLGLIFLPVATACVTRTIVSEEVFREVREALRGWCDRNPTLCRKKIAYLVTCDYCCSHWVALVMLLLSTWRPLDGIVGFVLSWFFVVLVANVYLGLYQIMRVTLNLKRAKLR